MKRRLLLIALLLLAPSIAQATSRPATPRQLEKWRSQIRQTLFIPSPLPALAPTTYSTFSPAPGVIAERISYATNYGLRIPAVIYRPEHPTAPMPAIVIVNGHGGDKTSWYAFYSGILYARAGAVVLTYDPMGEDERNSSRASETRIHDTVVPGSHIPEHLAGLMITDILQSFSYLAQRSDVDPHRIAISAYSMGSFHAVIAGALEPRLRALLLSGGGNLDGPGGYWDTSKPMCQGGAYRALNILEDADARGAILYALNQQHGPTLILNGTADGLITRPHTDEAFFVDLRDRTAAITGTRKNLFETDWFPGAGHRPNFVTRKAALWLQQQLSFPNWTVAAINALGESHISEWAARTGAHVGSGFLNELSEGGVEALSTDIPNLPRNLLQAIPEPEWQQHKQDFIWETWLERTKTF
ncbi:MAG TPA: acetylxylan esterase [Acidobacteriaceae bacterium]